MPRLPRMDAPGSRHHVMNRGARRQAVFLDDDACIQFLGLLGELPRRFGTRVHGYALMPNHFHVLVTAGPDGLGAAMQYLQSGYSRSINARKAWDGPVWRSRYKSRPVDSEDYWRHLLAYVHLNPVRARLVQHVDQSRWTSHGAYAGIESVPDWLDTQEHLALFGDSATYLEYLGDMVRGRDVAPDGFDPDALFARPERVAPRAIESRAPVKAEQDWPMSDESAWFALSAVTEADRETILTRRPGRSGNPLFWLATWWLPLATDQPAVVWASKLGVSTSSFTRGGRRLRARMERDETLRRRYERLSELLPSRR